MGQWLEPWQKETPKAPYHCFKCKVDGIEVSDPGDPASHVRSWDSEA